MKLALIESGSRDDVQPMPCVASSSSNTISAVRHCSLDQAERNPFDSETSP